MTTQQAIATHGAVAVYRAACRALEGDYQPLSEVGIAATTLREAWEVQTSAYKSMSAGERAAEQMAVNAALMKYPPEKEATMSPLKRFAEEVKQLCRSESFRRENSPWRLDFMYAEIDRLLSQAEDRQPSYTDHAEPVAGAVIVINDQGEQVYRVYAEPEQILETGQRPGLATARAAVKPRRCWINQPATLQPLHKLHGQRVLAVPYTDTSQLIYFLEGDVVSQVAPNLCLSEGWPATTQPNRDALELARAVRAEVLAIDSTITNSDGDGSTDRAPTGDDYNDLYVIANCGLIELCKLLGDTTDFGD